jgi:hypothetical protein
VTWYQQGFYAALEKLGYVSPAAQQLAEQEYGKWHKQHGQGRAWDPKTVQVNAETQQLMRDLDSAYQRYNKYTGRTARILKREIDFGTVKRGAHAALQKLGLAGTVSGPVEVTRGETYQHRPTGPATDPERAESNIQSVWDAHDARTSSFSEEIPTETKP